jgi:hypothetical protein
VAEITQINDAETLQRYLEMRSSEEARQIACRVSLRVLPLMVGYDTLPFRGVRLEKRQELALAVFRANFIAWTTAFYSVDFVLSVGAVETADAKATKVASGVQGSVASNVAKAAAAAVDARIAKNPAARAADSVSYADACFAVFAEPKLWQAIALDLERLNEGRTIIGDPLWLHLEPPKEVVSCEPEFENLLRGWGGSWSAIAQFYKSIRDGTPVSEMLSGNSRAALIYLSMRDLDYWEEENPSVVVSKLAEELSSAGFVFSEGSGGLDSEKVGWDFFISYASKDEYFARELDSVLKSSGYSTFVQFNDIRPGSHILQEMKRGLSGMGRLIAIYSPDYENSQYCHAEWDAAFALDVSGKERKIIPFMLHPTELNSFASQVIYTSLVGLDAEQRKNKILETVKAEPLVRSQRDTIKRLAETASPDIVIKDGAQLDITPNAMFDISVGGADFGDLPDILVHTADTICGSLPDNSPKVIGESLGRYARHVEAKKTAPIVGLIKLWALAVQREYESEGGGAWGEGPKTLFEQFFRDHQKFLAYFIHDPEREQIFAETEVDEDQASGLDLSKPVSDVAEKVEALSEIGGVTPALERVAKEYSEQAERLAYGVAKPDEAGSHIASPKRRFILAQLGFWERMLAVGSGIVTLSSTPQGQALLAALREALSKFMQFLR